MKHAIARHARDLRLRATITFASWLVLLIPVGIFLAKAYAAN